MQKIFYYLLPLVLGLAIFNVPINASAATTTTTGAEINATFPTNLYGDDIKKFQDNGFYLSYYVAFDKTRLRIFKEWKIEDDVFYFKDYNVNYIYDKVERCFVMDSYATGVKDWSADHAKAYEQVKGDDIKNNPIKPNKDNIIGDGSGEDNFPEGGVQTGLKDVTEIPQEMVRVLKIILPVGLIVLSILLGVSLIKRVIFSFL